jgi:5-dehydro-2-deoxygluconokinase
MFSYLTPFEKSMAIITPMTQSRKPVDAEALDLTIPLDVVTIGRAGVDLYPLQNGVGLDLAETFGKYLGGSAVNVAVAAARHGLRSAIVARTGEDSFGRFVRSEIARLGVSDRFVESLAGVITPVTFCEIFPPDDFPLFFYRPAKAPDLAITTESLDLEAIRSARVFWATATGLSEEPSREAHFAAWQRRERAPLTVLDLDYRSSLWASPGDAAAVMERALTHVTVAIGNIDECEVATGASNPHRAAAALLDQGVELAIVKLGAAGALAMTRQDEVTVPAVKVTVVNGLGAGDGFGGALCFGLLNAWPLQRSLQFASAAGAIVASRRECATAMPTTHEVTELMSAGSYASAG